MMRRDSWEVLNMKDQAYENLCFQVRSWMRHHEVMLKDLNERAGFPRGRLSNILNGVHPSHTNPTLSTLSQLAVGMNRILVVKFQSDGDGY